MIYHQEIYQDETVHSVYTQEIGLGPISALPLTGCLIDHRGWWSHSGRSGGATDSGSVVEPLTHWTRPPGSPQKGSRMSPEEELHWRVQDSGPLKGV